MDQKWAIPLEVPVADDSGAQLVHNIALGVALQPGRQCFLVSSEQGRTPRFPKMP